MDDFTLGKILLGKGETSEQKAAAASHSTASIIEMVAVTSSVSGEVVVKNIEEDPDEIWLDGEPGVDYIELDEDGGFYEDPEGDETEAPEDIVLDTTDGDGANIEDVAVESAAFTVAEYHEAAVAAAEEEVEQENDPVPDESATITDEIDDGDAEEGPDEPSENDPAPDEGATVEEISDEEYTLMDDDDPDESEERLEGVEASDGSTIVETTVSVKAGDRVMVSIHDGRMTVVGVIGGGDEEYAERMLLEQAQQEVAQEAEEAKAAAEAVVGIAEAAQEAADAANMNAQAAKEAAETAKTEAESATSAANEAKGSVSVIANDLNSVKTDESQTLADAIDGLTEKKVETMAAEYATNDDLKAQKVELESEIERSAGKIQTTLSAEYARKTDLTEAKAELQSQITQTSDKISLSVSNIAEALANTQSDDVKAAIQAAKAQLETASTDLADAKSALVTAQIEANNATINASLAQNLASDANAALENAQRELAEAQAYRDRLIQLGGTTEEIEEAEAAVTEAQNAVTEAQTAADEATANASAANNAADSAAEAVQAAENDVATAQEAYDLAVNGLNEASYSGIEQTADSITSRVTKTEMQEAVDAVEVGGRNYIRNGRGNVKEGFFKYFDSVNEDYGEHAFTSQKTYERIDIGSGFVLGGRDYEVGKEVVFSYEIMYTTWDFPVGTDRKEFWIGQRYESQKISGGDTTGQWRSITSHALPIVGQNGCELNEWYRVEYKTTIPEQAAEGIVVGSNIQFHNSNADVAASIAFRMRNVKLEYGNKATDWTPAPEDQEAYTDAAAGAVQGSVDSVSERVTVSETIIEQLSDSIASIVRGSEGASLVKQDENGLFYFDIEALQTSADATASGLSDLLKALGDIDYSSEETLLGKLGKMESELVSMGVKTEYIGKSTYTDEEGNEEPCLVLGETDSPFKLLITNKRFVFMEGSIETTYIKDDTLVTNNIEVKEEIRQGRWAWKIRQNGNMGLVWIGGDK